MERRVITVGVLLGLGLWLLIALAFVAKTHAQEVVWNAVDSALAIQDAAETYGVSEAWLLSVAHCEARMDPYAVGDSGHSFGLAQLNDRPTGLLAHFHSLGYGSAFDPYSAAQYMARVFSGEFAAQGVTWRRWSCR